MLEFNNLFDEQYYLLQNRDVAIAIGQGIFTSGLDHYQRFGQFERRSPSGFFAEDYYLSQNPDVAQAVQAGVFRNGLQHFINNGQAEGRQPSVFFNPSFYLGFYSDVDTAVANGALTPIEHFVKYGQFEKRDPFSEFYTQDYLAENQDVAQAVQATANTADPLTAIEHFVDYGQYEGRNFGPDFNTPYYLQQNPDIAAAVRPFGLSPIKHYLQFGTNEGRLSTAQPPGFDFGSARDLGLLSGTKNISESVNNTNPIDIYSFSLDTNNDFSLTLDGLSADADVYLAQDTNGNGQIEYDEIIASSELSGTNSEAISSFLSPGQYSVVVQQFEGNTNYNLRLSATPFSTASDRAGNTLSEARDLDAIGSVASDFVGTADTDDFYRFNLDTTSSISLSLNRLSADAKLELIQDKNGNGVVDDGEVLQTSTAGGATSANLNASSLAAGNYYVRVSPVSGDTNYNLNLTKNFASSVGEEVFAPIIPNQTLQGSLSTSDQRNPLRFGSFADDYKLVGASANQQVTVNLDSTNFDTYLQVVDAVTGQLIAENDDIQDGNTNSGLTFNVQSGVNYIIRVTSYDQQNLGIGNYTLTTSTTSPIVGSIAVGQTVNGDLSSTDLIQSTNLGSFSDDYQLTGVTAGQQVQVNLNSSELDSYLQLVNAVTGEVIVENDDVDINAGNTNSALSFTAQSGIEYIIRASSYAAGATGSYTLSTSGDITPPPLPSSISEFLNANLQDAQLKALALTLAGDNNIDRSDMLAIFDQSQNGDTVITSTELADFKTLAQNSTLLNMSDPVRYLTNQVAKDTTVNLNASQFSTIVGRWFLGTDPPPAVFNEESREDTGQTKRTTYELEYTALQGPLFGSTGQGRIGDIYQGSFGNCAFLAAVGSAFGTVSGKDDNKASSVLQNVIIDNGDNTYTMRFYADTNTQYLGNSVSRYNSNPIPQYVTVNRNVVTRNGNLFGARLGGNTDPSNPNNTPIWVVLLERAYAQWAQGYRQVANGYDEIGNGAAPALTLTRLTGRAVDQYYNGNPLANTPNLVTFEQIQSALNSGRFVEAGTFSGVNKISDNLIVPTHAYSVTNAYVSSTGEQRIVVRNPWGVDGYQSRDAVDDGFIDLSFNEFLSYYDNVNITA
ncbi:pre-peptidase C-terminal domain-containing protein [Floridanema aerugineum]|uniref:Pre-peptidase C-terminal domain-containing protein n=1 Tax=Floridaenema aerugineum BLCC-F46 TaxID=3153654 RepID=A0ABV4XBB6_9CYAN